VSRPFRPDQELSAPLASKAAILLMAGAVFIPGHLAGWVLERVFVVGSSAFCTFVVLEAGLLRRRVFGVVAPGAVLGSILAVQIVYLLGTLLSQFLGPLPFNPLELARYPAIASLILLIGTTADRRLTRAVGGIGRLSLVYAGIVTTALSLKVPIVSDLFEAVYHDTKTTIALPAKLRISIPFENPNYLAFYLLGVIVYLLYLDRTRLRPIYLVVASALMLFTGSKAGWLALSFVLAVMFCNRLWAFVSVPRVRNAVPLLSLMAFAVLAVLGFGVADRAVGGASRLESTIASYQAGQLLTEPSLVSRIHLVHDSLDAFGRSPLVGWGSGDHKDLLVFDNQYLLWLVRLGLIGTGLLLFLYGRLARAVFRGTRGLTRAGYVGYMVGVLIMLATGVFLENFRLLVVFLGMLAAFIGASDRDPAVSRKGQ
jgi:O-antigen ligase